MSPEEKEKLEAAEIRFRVIEAKYEEKKDNVREFIKWLQDQTDIIPADAKKITEKEFDNKKDMAFARFIIGKLAKHIHPDKHVNSDEGTKFLMNKITTLVNTKIIQPLKGL